ncbi:hypothetical protein ACR0ST_06735 [Aliidiomarina sp. Khilg15.8]
MLALMVVLSTMLPGNWSLTPVLHNSQTTGLRMNAWSIEAPAVQIESFKQRPSVRCTVLPLAQTGSWHCLDENRLYSLLQHGDVHLWVQSERSEVVAAPLPEGLNGEVLSQYQNAFEEVTVVRSRQPMFLAYSSFQRTQQQGGATLLMNERDSDTFVQQWQRGATVRTLIGQREADGGVTLIHTLGTTL